jgi:hypothetical protein
MFKSSVRIFGEKIYEMGFLEGNGVPVLYIGHRFLKVNRRPNLVIVLKRPVFIKHLLLQITCRTRS